MLVVGGGFLGSELACALGHRGTNHVCALQAISMLIIYVVKLLLMNLIHMQVWGSSVSENF